MNDPGIAHASPATRLTPRDQAARLPLAPGVYRFRDQAGRVLYLGRATSLRRRVTSYWGDLRDRAHLSRMVARIARIEAVACDSAHEAAWLERNLLLTRLPPWNRAPTGGQEVEVWIRLNASARTPGVEVVHEPATGKTAVDRHFGPYLGGRQVRQAVSGLCRVFPLTYASQDATGTHADMARALGVSEADRAILSETVAAVLDRDLVAVGWLRSRLAERRDAAARAEAFEFAAKLQQEIQALDWITGEQKVTRSSSEDFDVYGWSEGTLVRFTCRDGRLTEWSTRTCGAASAARYLSKTPQEWADFARRNAELAARLTARS